MLLSLVSSSNFDLISVILKLDQLSFASPGTSRPATTAIEPNRHRVGPFDNWATSTPNRALPQLGHIGGEFTSLPGAPPRMLSRSFLPASHGYRRTPVPHIPRRKFLHDRHFQRMKLDLDDAPDNYRLRQRILDYKFRLVGEVKVEIVDQAKECMRGWRLRVAWCGGGG